MNATVISFVAPSLQAWIRSELPDSLGDGDSHRDLAQILNGMTPAQLFPGQPVVDFPMAECCLAGLWLLANELDQSHQFSQQVSTTTGSFWHGIMHRREGDFSNAGYWFRRVGEHPVFPQLREAALPIRDEPLGDTLVESLTESGRWNPHAYIELCRRASLADDTALRDLCLRVGQLEWHTLFSYCCGQALGHA